jgi:hypothetical protein
VNKREFLIMNEEIFRTDEEIDTLLQEELNKWINGENYGCLKEKFTYKRAYLSLIKLD